MNSNWFTAVTSAPRRVPTVNGTVESLRWAGFNPYVFAEPGTSIEDKSAVGCVHVQRLGVWHNWVYAAEKAYESGYPHCLITQDDINVHEDTREVLELLFAKSKAYEMISVYTPRAYSYENNNVSRRRRKPGLYDAIQAELLFGAVGFAYRRQTLGKMLEHPLIDNWRGVKEAKLPEDAVNSDVAIGKICSALGIRIWFPTPSFGIHTSRVSSIPGHGNNDVKRNRNAEDPARNTEPLWEQLFPGGRKVEENRLR